MVRIVHNVAQGSPEWLALRAQHNSASLAAAMLGLSTKVKRLELLHARKTSVAKEFSEWVEKNVFERGHEAEAAARPHAEAFIGEDLFPTTMSRGSLLASCDGLTADRRIAWEHKQYNQELFESVTLEGEPTAEHIPQCQQALIATGAEKLLFTVSDGTPEKMAHCWIYPDPAWEARLVAGWHQFLADLAEYVPPEIVAPVTAAAVESLPTVSIRLDGAVAIIDNLSVFGERLRTFIDRLPERPSTDQEFADADQGCKVLQQAQDALEQAEAAALAQTSDIEKMRRTVATYVELARTTRLTLEKFVKARKEQIKVEIVTEGQIALTKHIETLNQRLGKSYMPMVPADFGGAIKGKKTVQSLREAVNVTLTHAKLQANEIADRIQVNLAVLREDADGYQHLFPDTATLVLKAKDDLQAAVDARIAAHKDAEAKRAEQAAAAPPPAPVTPAPVAAGPVPGVVAATTPAAPASPVPARADEAPTLTLSQISERLGFTVTADFLARLGFSATQVKASKCYRPSDFPGICRALVTHIEHVAGPGMYEERRAAE